MDVGARIEPEASDEGEARGVRLVLREGLVVALLVDVAEALLDCDAGKGEDVAKGGVGVPSRVTGAEALREANAETEPLLDAVTVGVMLTVIEASPLGVLPPPAEGVGGADCVPARGVSVPTSVPCALALAPKGVGERRLVEVADDVPASISSEALTVAVVSPDGVEEGVMVLLGGLVAVASPPEGVAWAVGVSRARTLEGRGRLVRSEEALPEAASAGEGLARTGGDAVSGASEAVVPPLLVAVAVAVAVAEGPTLRDGRAVASAESVGEEVGEEERDPAPGLAVFEELPLVQSEGIALGEKKEVTRREGVNSCVGEKPKDALAVSEDCSEAEAESVLVGEREARTDVEALMLEVGKLVFLADTDALAV